MDPQTDLELFGADPLQSGTGADDHSEPEPAPHLQALPASEAQLEAETDSDDQTIENIVWQELHGVEPQPEENNGELPASVTYFY